MQNKPSLSVVIPCYNYEKFVGKAIKSVQAQADESIELVVVDDGSTDNSWEVISNSGAKAYRLKNAGARIACVYGLDKTKSQFVLFLDADDELKPGAIAKIQSNLDANVAKLQFALTRVDAEGNFLSRARPSLETFRSQISLVKQVQKYGVYKSPPTSGNVFRRDVCELLRQAHYDKFVDGITLFAAPFLGDIVSLSDELGIYRIHGQNDSRIGQELDAAAIARDIIRFKSTMVHLQEVIKSSNFPEHVFNPEQLYTVKQREFYLNVALGKRPLFKDTLGIIIKTFIEKYSAKEKLALAILFVLASILPNKKSKKLVAYRLSAGERSLTGFLRKIAFE